MQHSPFREAFTPGTTFAQADGTTLVVEVITIGELIVPSGRIAACDPLTNDFADPGKGFERRAPIGSFPVELAIARLDGPDERVACARVRFADREVARWEPAEWEGAGPVEDGTAPAYGVDAGTGCFFDLEAAASAGDAVYEGWLAALHASQVDTWAHHVAPHGKANVAMFSSGWGDGIYTSYWGLDADGGIVELVTDFEVLIESTSERIEVPVPRASGAIAHPTLEKLGVTVRAPWSLFAPSSVTASGKLPCVVSLSDGTKVSATSLGPLGQRFAWSKPSPDARLVILVLTGGVRPLRVVERDRAG